MVALRELKEPPSLETVAKAKEFREKSYQQQIGIFKVTLVNYKD